MKAIVHYYDRDESYNSYPMDTIEVAEYPLMYQFFDEIGQDSNDFYHYSIEDFTPPPHNAKTLEEFFQSSRESKLSNDFGKTTLAPLDQDGWDDAIPF